MNEFLTMKIINKYAEILTMPTAKYMGSVFLFLLFTG